MDAFFTSISAMSLTGITTFKDGLANTFTVVGHIIIMILMQIGGLGVVTILTFLFSIFRKRLQFKNRLMISQAIAFNNYSEIVRFVRRLMVITVITEVLGAALGIPVFLRLYPNEFHKVLTYSVFYSISSFNNAGFDLFVGTSSFAGDLIASNGNSILTTDWLYYYFVIYNGVLSLVGGLSFIAMIDMFFEKKSPRNWTSFTKIVLIMTAGIVVIMSGSLFVTDGLKQENPMNLFEVVMTIVNCRTAGYHVYPISEISLPGKVICGITMFIGGSPLSTAGGIKVTTMFIIMISVISYFRGKRIAAFKRNFSDTVVAKSMTIVFIVVFFIVLAYIGLALFGVTRVNGEYVPVEIEGNLLGLYFFDAFSFFSNVGFYTGIEPYLSIGSKIILCVLMLIGHLGPMAFFQLFQNFLDKKANVHYSFVEEDFLIG